MALYKRSTFLIDPRFQLKFSFIVCSVILISTIIYPVIIYDFFKLVSVADPKGAELLETSRKELIFYLVLIQTVITGLVFLIFIFITHKVAGPIYKLKNHLADIRAGHPITPITFRLGDNFHDLAEEVSLFLETVAMNQENDFHYVDEISLYIENLSNVVPDDKKPILNEISRRLMDIKLRYKKDL